MATFAHLKKTVLVKMLCASNFALRYLQQVQTTSPYCVLLIEQAKVGQKALRRGLANLYTRISVRTKVTGSVKLELGFVLRQSCFAFVSYYKPSLPLSVCIYMLTVDGILTPTCLECMPPIVQTHYRSQIRLMFFTTLEMDNCSDPLLESD